MILGQQVLLVCYEAFRRYKNKLDSAELLSFGIVLLMAQDISSVKTE